MVKSRYFTTVIATLLVAMTVSCKKKSDEAPSSGLEEREEYSGGDFGTAFDQSAEAFGNSFSGMSLDERSDFAIGNSFMRANWVTAPASTTAIDGLGPIFNSRSCSGCHFKDGRGRPPVAGETSLTSMLIRLSIPGTGVHGQPVDDPNYGGQLSNNAIFGVDPEGDVDVVYDYIKAAYPDGTEYELRKPTYTFKNLNYGSMAGNIMFSPRVGNQVYGLGLLEAIDESTILSYADEADANGDGVSGRPNRVWDQINQTVSLGRFGWKANQPSIPQQVAGAFIGDMGLTTTLNPNENLIGAQLTKYGALPTGGSPEIPDSTFDEIVFYSRTLSVPARRNWKDQQVLEGKQLFMQAKCSSCHIPVVKTGTQSNISYVKNQTIRPFTDLLLHDMGDALADNRPDFLATGNEWRTPPLWGLGLVKTVNGHTTLLHDGRARNFEEAVLWHGGEGENAKKAFMNYTKSQRDALIKFLESL